MRAGLRAALATPLLRTIQGSWCAASVGGWALFVALSVYAFDRGGAAAVGLAAVARMVPAGLAAPLAGVLVDRRPRRDVLVAVCAGRAVLLALMGLAVSAEAPLAPVVVLAALVTVLMAAHRPAQAALLPSLADT